MIIKQIEEPGRLISVSEGHQFRSGYVVLDPGKEVGEHATEAGQELIIILEGTATVVAEGESSEAPAISEVLIPAHTVHNVRNATNSQLKYVYVVSTNKE